MRKGLIVKHSTSKVFISYKTVTIAFYIYYQPLPHPLLWELLKYNFIQKVLLT